VTIFSWLSGSILAAAVIACTSSPGPGSGSGSDSGMGSGIAGTKKLTELSASEQDDLCAYTVAEEDGPGTVTCGDRAVYLEDEAMCALTLGSVNAQCQATVTDVEDCARAIGMDPCNTGVAACATFFACVPP